MDGALPHFQRQFHGIGDAAGSHDAHGNNHRAGALRVHLPDHRLHAACLHRHRLAGLAFAGQAIGVQRGNECALLRAVVVHHGGEGDGIAYHQFLRQQRADNGFLLGDDVGGGFTHLRAGGDGFDDHPPACEVVVQSQLHGGDAVLIGAHLRQPDGGVGEVAARVEGQNRNGSPSSAACFTPPHVAG